MEGYTEVFAWGEDYYGQLGLGGKQVGKTYSNPRFCSFNIVIRALSCGEEHSAFIADCGHVYTMGSNADGRLGIGDSSVRQSSSPYLIEALEGFRAVSVSCGWGHSAVVLDDGSAYSWGVGEFGALGNGSMESQWAPTKLKLPRDCKAIQVSCGSRHTAIVVATAKSKGKLLVCGAGEAGQLGTGRGGRELIPTYVSLSEDLRSAACGVFHTALLTATGKILTTGANSDGQLGLGNRKPVSVPTRVAALDGVAMSKVACGHYTAALCERGNLYLWGTGVFGELLSPMRITSINVALKSVDAGGSFGAAVDIEGGIWTWGSNSSGELGVGDFEARVNPFPIRTLQSKQVSSVSCGGTFAIALGANVDHSARSNVRPALSSDRDSLPIRSPKASMAKEVMSPFNQGFSSFNLPIAHASRSPNLPNSKTRRTVSRGNQDGFKEITAGLESMQLQQEQMRSDFKREQENRLLLEQQLHELKRPELKPLDYSPTGRGLPIVSSPLNRGQWNEGHSNLRDRDGEISMLKSQLAERDRTIQTERNRYRLLEVRRPTEDPNLEDAFKEALENLKAEKALRLRVEQEFQDFQTRSKDTEAQLRSLLKRKDEEAVALRLDMDNLKKAIDYSTFTSANSKAEREERDIALKKLKVLETDSETAKLARKMLEEECESLRLALHSSKLEIEKLRSQTANETEASPHWHTGNSSFEMPPKIEVNPPDTDRHNRQVFQTLETNLMLRARQYKERTLHVLATPSPLRGSRSASPETSMTNSPLPARISRYKLKLSARESKENVPYFRPSYLRDSKSVGDLSELHSPNSSIHSEVVAAPVNRYQKEEEATPPTFREQETQGFQCSLTDISAKLELLKQNKSALETRMHDFESKLRLPRRQGL